MRTALTALLLTVVFASPLYAQEDPMEAVGRMLGQTGEQIRTAVESGQMAEADAWDEWYSLRDDILQDALDTGTLTEDQVNLMRREVGKAEVPQRLDYEGRQLKQAVANGDISEDEAWAAWEERRQQILQDAVDTGAMSAEDAANYGDNKDNNREKRGIDRRLEEAGDMIKEAMESGEITKEEAWAEWYQAKEELIDEAVDAGEMTLEEAHEYHDAIHKLELSEKLKIAGQEIREDYAAGALTEDQAWDEWQVRKDDIINEALELGEVSERTATEFRRDLEKTEVGQRIKGAIAKGEITEEEGKAEWDDYISEAESRWAEEDAAWQAEIEDIERTDVQDLDDASSEQASAGVDRDNLPNDEWAQYVRSFIARYQLDDAQQQRAWRSYENAKRQDDRAMQRLRRSGGDRNDERSEANARRAAEMHERLFERLKAELDRLPTRTQRRQAGD